VKFLLEAHDDGDPWCEVKLELGKAAMALLYRMTNFARAATVAAIGKRSAHHRLDRMCITDP
jgi:hypothetical protein